jgi:hypothetical protein
VKALCSPKSVVRLHEFLFESLAKGPKLKCSQGWTENTRKGSQLVEIGIIWKAQIQVKRTATITSSQLWMMESDRDLSLSVSFSLSVSLSLPLSHSFSSSD